MRGAVQRNRFRRLLRESFRLNRDREARVGRELVLMYTGAPKARIGLSDLEAAVRHLLQEAARA